MTPLILSDATASVSGSTTHASVVSPSSHSSMVGVHPTAQRIPLSFTVTVTSRITPCLMETIRPVTGPTTPPATPAVGLAVREILPAALQGVLLVVARTGHRLRHRQCRAGIL